MGRKAAKNEAGFHLTQSGVSALVAAASITERGVVSAIPAPFMKPVPRGRRGHSNAKRRRDECFKKQKGKCFYCKKQMVKSRGHQNSATLEHRRALSDGGTHSRKNLVATCKTCNRLKGRMAESDFLNLLSKLTG